MSWSGRGREFGRRRRTLVLGRAAEVEELLLRSRPHNRRSARSVRAGGHGRAAGLCPSFKLVVVVVVVVVGLKGGV